MTRPLYLDRPEAEVALDGTALRVTLPASADRWFPLQRLSRVVCRRGVSWRTEALLACAEYGIGVTFADDAGEVIGAWISPLRAPASLTALLLDFTARPAWHIPWDNWLTAQRDLAVTSVAYRCQLRDPRTARAADVLRRLRMECQRLALEHQWLELTTELCAPLTATIIQTLRDGGIALERLGVTGLRLEQDLTELLLWDCYLPALRHLQHGHSDANITLPRAAADLLQRREQRLATLLREILSRLHRFLLELETWH